MIRIFLPNPKKKFLEKIWKFGYLCFKWISMKLLYLMWGIACLVVASGIIYIIFKMKIEK